MAGQGLGIVTLSKKGIGQYCFECQKLFFIGWTMLRIFSLKVDLGLTFGFSEEYNGYLLICWHRPRLVLGNKKITTENDIPF